MKFRTGLCLAVFLACSSAYAETDLAIRPDQVDLKDGRAPIAADGEYKVNTTRVRIPPNKDLPPHGPKQGYFIATVISGTLQLGFGKEFDESGLRTLPPGSVFTHPATQQHFARSGNEPVVLQITTVGAPAKAGQE